jgi:oligosaccharide repeat unit polymerase
MEQDWALHGPQGFPQARTYSKPNRSASILPEAIGICAIVIICLVWEMIYPSPSIVLLFGLVGMSYVNYLIGGRDVLYPAFTYTSIWALVAAAYNFCPIEIDRIGWKTVFIFLAGAASFSIGSLLGNRPFFRTKHLDSREMDATDNRDNPQARNVLLVCAILVTLLFIINIIRIAGGISGITPMFLLKLNLPGSPLEDADFFTSIIIGSGGLLPVLTLWVLLIEEERRWKIVLCTICVCLFPLFVTQRGLVMVAFCGCITLFLLKRKDRSFVKTVKPLSFAAALIVVAMALLSITKPWAQGPNGYNATEGAWMYIAGPLATFDYAVYHPSTFEDQPAAVFAQVLTPLSELKLVHYRTLMEVDGQKTDRFVFVPFPGNVYTAYKPYYQDFGAIGCFVAFIFFGFIEGHLFYAAVRRNRFAIFFFAYLGSALMFTTFDDNYHSFSRHLNILVFTVGYFWIMKRIRIRL